MSVDMLHTEMQKCMDELDVLQGRRQSHVKHTVPVKIKPDVDDEEPGQWADQETSDKRSSRLERQQHMRVQEQPKRVRERSSDREKPVSNPRKESKEVKKRGAVKRKMKFVDLAEKLWSVESEDQLRSLLYETLSSGSFLGNVSDKVQAVLEEFIDHVVEDSGELVSNLKDAPDPDDSDMEVYGISMFVATEHLRLRGLRELIREEMLVFAEFFENTSLDGISTKPSSMKYLLFLEYYNKLTMSKYDGHHRSVAMSLRVIGADIARKMLILATHLVEIVVALGAYEELTSR